MKFPEELANAESSIGGHLHKACRNGNVAVVHSMLDIRADIDLKDNRDGSRPANVRFAPKASVNVNSRIVVPFYAIEAL